MSDRVQRFFDAAGAIIATDKAEWFKHRVHMKLRQYQITSPVEQLLFIAMHTMAEVHGLYNSGLTIQPQNTDGLYKVDCFLWSIGIETRVRKRVVLECGSWRPYDRSPEQSTAEKKLDRFRQRQVLTLHYSGQEIWDDPFLVAAEALATIHPDSRTHPGNQSFYSTIKDLARQAEVKARAVSLLRRPNNYLTFACAFCSVT